ncbi:MAG: c-type cytochrome biogenesis protein CcmI [Cellvibrionaceae bacterium]|nr:c-type cytochrome biogenesis protein CcmI [Cellvibrionaceae bacterium]
MLQLWLGALCLLVLALIFVLWPLRRQDGDNAAAVAADQARQQALNVDLYQQRKQEIDSQLQRGEIDKAQQQALLRELDLELLAETDGDNDTAAKPQQGGRLALLLGSAALCAFVFVFYQYNGAADDMALDAQIKAKFKADRAAMEAGAELNPALAKALIGSLEARLGKQPQNVQYRYLLARTHTELGQYVKAIDAYRKVLSEEESALVMSELAQLLFAVGGNKVTPDIEQLIDKTLKLEPDNTAALGLDGIRHYQAQNYSKAISAWERAIGLLGPNSMGAQSLAAGVVRAQSLLATQGGDNGAGAAGQVQAASSVTVKVSLAEGIELPAEHTVFVYARAWQGASVPLAITRLQVKDLPAEVELTEAMAMAPGMSIAQFPELELVARVSASGNAAPQSGDWQVSVGPLRSAQLKAPVQLSVSEQLP